jgi:hypothetical protein
MCLDPGGMPMRSSYGGGHGIDSKALIHRKYQNPKSARSEWVTQVWNIQNVGVDE